MGLRKGLNRNKRRSQFKTCCSSPPDSRHPQPITSPRSHLFSPQPHSHSRSRVSSLPLFSLFLLSLLPHLLTPAQAQLRPLTPEILKEGARIRQQNAGEALTGTVESGTTDSGTVGTLGGKQGAGTGVPVTAPKSRVSERALRLPIRNPRTGQVLKLAPSARHAAGFISLKGTRNARYGTVPMLYCMVLFCTMLHCAVHVTLQGNPSTGQLQKLAPSARHAAGFVSLEGTRNARYCPVLC